MNKLTNQEIEFTLQCVKINRLKLSPVPSNNFEDKLCRQIEDKLEKCLKNTKNIERRK